MRISPLQNYSYNNIKFCATTPMNVDLHRQYEPQENQPKNEYKIPEWVRKSTLFGLIAIALANDPVTKNYFKSEEDKYNENLRKEYFENVSKSGLTSATHHLNQLADIDLPTIKSNNHNNYHLKLKLDNDDIDFSIYIPDASKNELNGIFKLNNKRAMGYKAIFNEKNPNEFEVYIRDKKNQKYVFGRTEKGQLYRLIGNKRIFLNNKNVQKYQEKLEDIEKKEFFSTENPTWRNIYFLLLFLLTLNEWGHDLERKEAQANKNKNEQ